MTLVTSYVVDGQRIERTFPILSVDRDRTIHLWPIDRTLDMYPPDRTPAACGRMVRRGGAAPFTGAHLCKGCRAAVIEQQREM